MPEHTEHDSSAWSSRAKLAFGVFAIIAAYFLVAEHRAHVLPYLPLLLLAACPLMHVFMHGGHGGHGGHHGQGGPNPPGASSGGSDTNADGLPARDSAPKGTGHQQHGGRP
jgi:hypothetical protein